MPTKPEQLTASPSRISAIASSAVMILSWSCACHSVDGAASAGGRLCDGPAHRRSGSRNSRTTPIWAASISAGAWPQPGISTACTRPARAAGPRPASRRPSRRRAGPSARRAGSAPGTRSGPRVATARCRAMIGIAKRVADRRVVVEAQPPVAIGDALCSARWRHCASVSGPNGAWISRRCASSSLDRIEAPVLARVAADATQCRSPRRAHRNR